MSDERAEQGALTWQIDEELRVPLRADRQVGLSIFDRLDDSVEIPTAYAQTDPDWVDGLVVQAVDAATTAAQKPADH